MDQIPEDLKPTFQEEGTHCETLAQAGFSERIQTAQETKAALAKWDPKKTMDRVVR